AEPASVWFATVAPAYLDKTNATAVHAALRLPRSAPAYDAIGSMRSTLGALRPALGGRGPALVAAADVRSGLPGSGDAASGGDARAGPPRSDGRVADAERRRRRRHPEDDRGARRTPGAPHGRGAGRGRRPDPLREVPLVARCPERRAAAPTGADADVLVGRRP